MKRKIKFRYWDKWNEQMSYSDSMKILSDFFILYDAADEGGNESILMQYTGLKDKNGKEIYEGDIISNIQARENVVFWYGNGFHYRNYHAEALPLDDLWNPYDAINMIEKEPVTGHEVIGNIHENPELL